jgi:DNA polymerase-3 subunit delta'
MQFSKIIGQERLIKRLVHSAGKGRIPHAQLFSGADGRGTLALALAYAQYLNCEHPSYDDSCGMCHNCRKYQIIQHPDLHFALPVPAAMSSNFMKDWTTFFNSSSNYPTLEGWYAAIKANSGVISDEQAANINAALNFKPYESKYKVQIIWHAELMHPVAANELLKLIEEPSPHTLLLLTTSNSNAMLRTILSRTQEVALPPIADDAIAAALSKHEHALPEKAQTIAAHTMGDYAVALQACSAHNSAADYMVKFEQLMRICSGNKPDNVIALLLWADGICKAYGREQQKQFLSYGLNSIRNYFMLNQNIGIPMPANTPNDYVPRIHAGNVQALYDEFNLALGQLSANINSRMLFTDMALKTIKHINMKYVG